MVNQLKVNGKLQDVIITKNYKENELFKKLNKKLPYTVLEYLVVNDYKYEDVKKHLHNNDNVILQYTMHNNAGSDNSFKILSKFKFEGTSLKNLNASNEGDKFFDLDLDELKLDDLIISRANYPFYAVVTLNTTDDDDDDDKGKDSKKKKNKINFFVSDIDFLESVTIDIEEYKNLRNEYTTQEWLNLIFNTIGYDADTLTPFEKFSFLVRLIPFCIAQYHSLELGNKETAKSYFYSTMSGDFSTSISSGDVSMAKLVRNNNSQAPGLLQSSNVVHFDELTNLKIKDKNVGSTVQTFMQDGNANRDDNKIQGKASLVFTGNIVDFETSVLNGDSLFDVLKENFDNETVFDKLHFFSPGWKYTKVNETKYIKENAPKIRRDYFLCILNIMREEYTDYLDVFKDKIRFIDTKSGRDMRIKDTIAGLIILLHPNKIISDEELEAFAYIALIGRKALLRELEIINENEYNNFLKVENVENKKEIGFEELSNFIINISETFLESKNINLENIEYYYLDYYKDYDVTRKINEQYDFEMIEPTIVIKCSNNPLVYKLAISSYGIKMNILEVNEGKTKENIICNTLTENFMLIETNENKNNIQQINFKRLNKSTSTFEELKVTHKKNKAIVDILDTLISEQSKQLSFYNIIKNLENKIETQNQVLLENQKTITKLHSLTIIKDILNLIYNAHINIPKELLYLRTLLFDQQDETLTEDSPNNFPKMSLGSKIYKDYKGLYRQVFSFCTPNKYKLEGKEYISTQEQEILPTTFPITVQEINIKSNIINDALHNHIKSIDDIESYVQSNDLIKLASITYFNDSIEILNSVIKNLDTHIKDLNTLIENYEPIKELLKSLNAPYNFSLSETTVYLNYLKDLLKNIENYIDTYVITNNQENLAQNTLLNLKETIYDNNYISRVEKNLKD